MSATLFQIDLKAATTPFPHVWEGSLGMSGPRQILHPKIPDMVRRQKREVGFQRLRFHNILGDYMNVAKRESAGLEFCFADVDKVYDAILETQTQPLVGLCFMPEALARGQHYFHTYKGNVTPPRDFGEWEQLIEAFTRHVVKRYGILEVSTWLFEVWNEPNLPEWFWHNGTKQDYFDLYATAAKAIKRVSSQLRVGGPASAKSRWIGELAEYCEKNNVPLDFLSTHQYPTDAAIEMDGGLFQDKAAADRDSMRLMATQARLESRKYPLYYNEWHISPSAKDIQMTESYAAAFTIRTAAQVNGLVDMYGPWLLIDLDADDIKKEPPAEGYPFSMGLLTADGVPKPMYRAFQMLHEAGRERLPVKGSHATVDVLAVKGSRETRVFLTNWERPLHPISEQKVELDVSGYEGPATVICRRIDEKHGNVLKAWKDMGSPAFASREQVAAMEKASELVNESVTGQNAKEITRFSVTLAEQSVVELTLKHS